jgi:hypothetical protein
MFPRINLSGTCPIRRMALDLIEYHPSLFTPTIESPQAGNFDSRIEHLNGSG